MESGGITSETVQRTLKAIRRDGDRATSSLTALAVVRERLVDRGFPDDPVHRLLVLSDLLADIVTRRLAAARGPSDAGNRESGSPGGEVDGRARLTRDFQAEDAVRQAWSSLYHRFFATRPFRAGELSQISGFSPRHLRRCFALGYDLLSQALAEMEAAPLASGAADRAASAAPSTPLVRGNPPRRMGSFVGRAEAVIAVRERLRTVGILTLMGPGGVGKTRLAVEALRSIAGQFRDGAWFIALDALREGALVPGTVARTLEIEEQAGRPAIDVLVDALAGRQLLLVLDNCEHVIEASADLADELLRHCPDLCILATSRKRLNIEGEAVFPVAALALPAAGKGLPADRERLPVHRLMDFAAVRLFVERAAAGEGGFRLDNGNAAAVVEICRQLDGIPLAIEIVAPHAQRLTVAAIAAQLHEILPRVWHRSQGTPERQKTVQAAIAWSYRLMTEAEKRCSARLAVFRGGWTFDAAREICGDDWIDSALVEAILFSLHDSSLIVDDSRGDEPRGRYLETLREYAHLQLAASGERQAMERRHAECFTRYAEQAEPELKGPNQAAWLNRLEIDHDNLRAAIAWALETGEIEIGLRLGGALWRFWYTRGYVREGWGYLEQLLAVEDVDGPDAIRAKALHAAGTLAIYLPDEAGAKDRLEACLALRRRLGDEIGVADTLSNLAVAAQHRNEPALARQYFEESLLAYRRCGHLWGVANALNALASVARELDDYAAAQRFQAEVLAIATRSGDEATIADGTYWMAHFEEIKGNYDAARRLYQQSIALYGKLGDRRSLAYTMSELALIAYETGDNAEATAYLTDSLSTFTEMQDRESELRLLLYLCMIQVDTLDLPEAKRYLDRAHAIAGEVDDPRLDAHLQYCEGYLALGAGNAEAALPALADSAKRWLAQGQSERCVEAIEGMAIAHDRLGHHQHACPLAAAAFDWRRLHQRPIMPIRRNALDRLRFECDARHVALGAFPQPQCDSDLTELIRLALDGGSVDHRAP